MKKIWGILSFFLGFGLAVCLVAGFFTGVSASVPKTSVFVYKLLSGVQYFLSYLPVILVTGFVVSCSVHFGRNSEGSTSRFSVAMVGRFKTVVIISIVMAALLTLSTELFGVLISQKKKTIINQPKLINEYIKVGNNLFENGYYERALRYADAALKLDENNKAAADLKGDADVEINRARTSNLRIKLYESVKEAEKVDRVKINAQQINEVYKFYLQAQQAFEKKEWFNAHYYAELGINLATPKDPNLEELKKLSTSAWNNLTAYHDLSKSKKQQAFDKKYEGYLALVEKDDLKAYYIFRELFQSSREYQSDPDVVFYLQVAENRINEKYFFIDETFELESFECANDIYFAHEYKDGSKDIIYIKGITTVEETGQSIQYLRDLTIKSIARDGSLFRTMHVPYAKVLPVSTKTLPSTTKELLGLDDEIERIPYVMLKSVGRDKPNTEIGPLYTYENGETTNLPEYMLFALPYDDFLMLENVTNDSESISLAVLLKLVFGAVQYGFSSEVYGQALMNRLLFPLIIVIMFILLGGFAWNNRIGTNQYFKFSWAFAFPLFIVVAAGFYNVFLFIYKLLNYVFLGSFGIKSGLMIGIVFYVFALIFVSVIFLSRRSKV